MSLTNSKVNATEPADLKATVRRFKFLEHMIEETAEAIRPSERLTVSQAAERYHYVNLPGTHVGPFSFEKTPYLREPQDELASLDFTGAAFVGPARTGKALALDTQIATPAGWTTMGDIEVGDEVFDEHGHPVRVIAATGTMVDHDCYRIEFDDSTSVIADGGHIWAVDDARHDDRRVTLSTEEISRTHRWAFAIGRTRPRYRIALAAPIALPRADLPVDPYFVGLWLGDGFSDRPTLTLNRADADHICERLTQKGMRCYRKPLADGRFADNVRVACGNDDREIWSRMRSIGLLGDAKHKHVPQRYLRGSIEQRRELLQGLLDTDGSTGSHSASFHTTLPTLQDAAYELLVSLGVKAHLRAFENPGRVDTLRVDFTPDDPSEVFSLPRHIADITDHPGGRRRAMTRRRAIRSVDKVESVPVKCIQVDSPTSLFLAGKQMVPTHNSAMFLNWLAYTAICDPADAMIVNMTGATARDWSMQDLARMIRHSPEFARRLTPGRQNDNVFDKKFLSGMRLLIKWPTISELSGKTIPRLWLMDYDRMTQNVDGEGNPFDLTRKRAQTFGRFGMCMAEASPGFPVQNAKWIATSPHEAPPTEGILAIYNRGDRRRWYWRCLHCNEPFEASFKHLTWPDIPDHMEAAEQAELACPACGSTMKHEDKHELNMGGRWLKEGQTWQADGSITGTPRRSDIASFWLKGPAAAFASWSMLVYRYLTASEEYERTGSEESLKTTINVDQGEPYTFKALEAGRLPEELKDRAEDWGGSAEYPVIPEGVRFLIKTVDVQARAFVVQTHGFTDAGDIALVDFKKIRRSVVLGDDGAWQTIDPAARPEDWDVLIDEMEQVYPLGDGSDRFMRIKAMACDSGGKEGVTANAYSFVRRLRTVDSELSARFHLVKGASSKNAPRVSKSYPDSARKDRFANARGEIPVWLLNPNLLKDQASAMLGRPDAGGMVRFPVWAEDWVYSQLTTEVRTPKGWENLVRKRNEAWDLLYYAIAVSMMPSIKFEKIDWENPPGWAADWDENDMVFSGNAEVALAEAEVDDRPTGLAGLGEALG